MQAPPDLILHQFFLRLTEDQFIQDVKGKYLTDWLTEIANNFNYVLFLLNLLVELVFDKTGGGVVYRIWFEIKNEQAV